MLKIYLRNMPKKLNSQGQILIVVLLIMVVALAIGLSVATRSLTNLRVSTQSEFSQRAFSAAEAGIEKALGSGNANFADNFTVDVGGSSVAVDVTSQSLAYVESVLASGGVQEIKVDTQAPQNRTATSIVLYWGNNATGSDERTNVPSIEYTLVDVDGSGNVIIPPNVGSVRGKAAMNPPGSTRANGFLTGTAPASGFTSPGGKSFQAKTEIFLNANTKIVRIRAIYNTATIYVESGTSSINVSPAVIPQQVDITVSKAKVPIGEEGGQSNLTRAVQVVKSKPALPAIFDYVLFGANGIIKQ